jgi:hypothetical protein
MSWEETLNKQGIIFFQFHKNGDEKVNILHECKESRDVDRLLRASMTSEFINDENEISIRNSLYLKELQNTTEETIEEITIQNNTTQHKQKLEQLEIKYLLCNTNINPYIIEIMKKLESMKNIKQIEPNETNDMNIVNEIQNKRKQWNYDLIFLQNQTPTKLTIEII